MKRFVIILSVFAVAVCMSGMAYAQEKQPTTVVLKGNPMGGVKFDHAAHVKVATGKCDACHHASKPEKPLKSAHQECTDCHTKAATPPMKTAKQAAFHAVGAKAGTCIDCHVKQNAAGKKAPTKCPECHKKENV